MTINGQRVRIAEGLAPGFHLTVEGAYWGSFVTFEVAVRAAVAVLQAPKFH